MLALTPKVMQSRDVLRAKHVGNGLYGFHRMDDSYERRQLMEVLAGKVNQCREVGLAIGIIFLFSIFQQFW